MAREPVVHHPIQKAIDDIWHAGHTPRIQVDARHKDVVVPEFVKDKWGARLLLDLDANWPLKLEYSRAGLSVDLAFQGYVSRCVVPWDAIYVVLDRTTGRGVVIESHLPRAIEEDPVTQRKLRESERPTPLMPSIPRSTAQSGGSSPGPLAHSGGSPGGLAHSGSAPGPRSVPAPARTESMVEARPGSDEEAKRRRARFKVIDGGG